MILENLNIANSLQKQSTLPDKRENCGEVFLMIIKYYFLKTLEFIVVMCTLHQAKI